MTVSPSKLFHSRRQFLATVATAGVAGMVGCAGNQSDGDSNSVDLPDKSDGEDDPAWRMAGHDARNTFLNRHAEGPSENPSIRWTFSDSAPHTLGDYRNHCPLIVDGTVYTTVELSETVDDVEKTRSAVVAIDAETGESEQLFTVDGRAWRLAIADGRLYVVVNAEVLAYDLAQQQVTWRTDPLLFRASALRPVGDTLIATANGAGGHPVHPDYLPKVFVLDAETGAVRWDGNVPRHANYSVILPVVTNEAIMQPYSDTQWHLETGTPEAELPTRTDYQVLADGELYGLVDDGKETVFRSFEWPTMQERWTYIPEKRVSAGWPIVLEDVVVVSGEPHGMLGIDRTTGELLWRTKPYDDCMWSLFRIATEQTVYIAHEGGAATALDATDGSIQWQVRTDSMDWSLFSGGALADDLLVTVGADGTLYAIS